MINRRNVLALGAATAAGVALWDGYRPTATPDHTAHQTDVVDHTAHTAHTEAAAQAPAGYATFVPWAVRMPIPPVLAPVSRAGGVDTYRLPIVPATAEILPGRPTPVRSFGGSFVGPTIRARTGRPVRVTFANRLDVAANVHLHGGHTPAAHDGYPMDVIAPGASRVYDYPNTQRGATLWYHDHTHHTEAENVYLGLHGFYLIDDPAEAHLRLPTGEYDVPIALRDAHVDENGQLVYALQESFNGRPTLLANGAVQPFFPVAARKYRLRLLNSGNERMLSLRLEGGGRFVQVGSDGGLLPAPVALDRLGIASAERADVVVDFSRLPLGTKVVLVDEAAGPVLRFDVTRRAIDLSRVPDRLRPLPPLGVPTVTRDVRMEFDFSTGVPLALINGKPYDEARVDFRVKAGSTEIWRVFNADSTPGSSNPNPTPHTFHLHQTHFRVLDRGTQPLRPDDAGLKDTIKLLAGESARLQVTFTEHLGLYMFHCHFLEHSSLGMMAQMEVVP